MRTIRRGGPGCLIVALIVSSSSLQLQLNKIVPELQAPSRKTPVDPRDRHLPIRIRHGCAEGGAGKHRLFSRDYCQPRSTSQGRRRSKKKLRRARAGTGISTRDSEESGNGAQPGPGTGPAPVECSHVPWKTSNAGKGGPGCWMERALHFPTGQKGAKVRAECLEEGGRPGGQGEKNATPYGGQRPTSYGMRVR